MTQRQTSDSKTTNSNKESGTDSNNESEKQINCAYTQLVRGDSGLDKLIVDNPFSRCEIYLQGAHVTQFMPKAERDLLWISEDAHFVVGKAIRGGIPICWPWFGPSPYGEGSPAHGFARTQLWQLTSVDTNDKGYTQVCLEIRDNSQTRALWPFEFLLQCTVTVGDVLTIDVTTHNLDNQPMSISEAIHSYFAVSDVEQIEITNLDNHRYVDKLAANEQADGLIVQQGAVFIEKATDRIYVNSPDEHVIVDRDANRSISVIKQGAHDTVVWNPWQETAKRMADFDDLGYHNMVCVEAANSQINQVVIEQGQSHTISQQIGIVGQE